MMCITKGIWFGQEQISAAESCAWIYLLKHLKGGIYIGSHSKPNISLGADYLYVSVIAFAFAMHSIVPLIINHGPVVCLSLCQILGKKPQSKYPLT